MRTPCVDKNGMKKGAWTEEEDNKLRAYILRYGHWNWRLLPKFAGLARCGKSCRLRWVNYLKPGVKRGNYSKEEEDLITILHDELGNKWSAIAAKLPGRTDNEIKNYWHTHLKKRRTKRISGPNPSCENNEEASLTCREDMSGKPENFQGSDEPILDSSGSDSRNWCRVNWDSEDSASCSRSGQEMQAGLAYDSPIGFFEDYENDERVLSSFDGSFWNVPCLVDTFYGQDESFSPFDEGVLYYHLFT